MTASTTTTTARKAWKPYTRTILAAPAPTDGELIADALRDIASALRGDPLTPRPDPQLVTAGSEEAPDPKSRREIAGGLEALPEGAYAELLEPLDVGGLVGIPYGEKVTRIERTDGTLSEFFSAGGRGMGNKWWLNQYILADLGLTADDFSLPAPKTEEELEDELEALPGGAFVDFDEPRLSTEEMTEWAIPLNTPIARVRPSGAWQFHFIAAEDNHPWSGTAGMVRSLGLTADDFSLPESNLEVIHDAAKETDIPPHLLTGEEEDVINEPSHYRKDGLECIDFNYDLTGPWFSVVRYVWRFMDKGNPIQDLEKALRYIDIAKEKGLPQPRNDQRSEVFRDLWLNENDDDIAELRFYILRWIFADTPYLGERDAVRDAIEELIELIKEEQA